LIWQRLPKDQPDLPLMLLTGFLDQAKRMRELGVTAFLKPAVDICNIA
jgi:hypothetical protein